MFPLDSQADNAGSIPVTRSTQRLFGRAWMPTTSTKLSAPRGSPESVETSVVVISLAGAGLLAPACRVGQAVACPLFLLPGAAVVSGVKGGPQGGAQHP